MGFAFVVFEENSAVIGVMFNLGLVGCVFFCLRRHPYIVPGHPRSLGCSRLSLCHLLLRRIREPPT